MEEIRRSLIATIMGHVEASHGTPQYKAQCRKNLEGMSIDQLNNALAKIATENAQALQQSQSALENIRAQRHAEATLFDHQVNKPQRLAAQQEQINRDVATFATAAKELRTVGISEANFRVLLEALGDNFTLEAAKAFIEHSGATMMSAPDRHQLAAWSLADQEAAKQAEAQRVAYLKNLPDEQLRSEVRQSGQQAHQQAQQVEAQRQIEVHEQRDAAIGYPPLPEINTSTGERIDSRYLIALSNQPIGSEKYKLWRHIVARFGHANVNRRLNGIS